MSPWRLGRRPYRSGHLGLRRPTPRRSLARACLNGLSYPFVVRSDLARFSGDSRRPLVFSARDADAIEAEIYSHLIPIRRRLWLQRSIILVFRAAVLLAGIQLLASFLSFAALPPHPALVNGLSAVVALVALGVIVRQRVTFSDAARVVDRRLGLDQVVGTAVELTANGADGRLARLQTRRATDVIRGIDSSAAIRFGLPWRDLAALGGFALLTGVFVFLASLRIAWPGTPPPEDIASDPSIELAFDSPMNSTFYEGDGSAAFDSGLFDRSFDDYRSDLEGQNLSPEEMALRIAEIQAQLAQRAEALNRQRQALDDLADALSDSSAASEAADSIRKRDYQRAAQQLSGLGAQAGQLSQRARRDLAQRLNDAASKVAPNNQDLAARMRRAAQQLASNDATAQQQALSDLAEGVNQAGDQLRSLADSGEPFDPSSMSGEGGSMPSDLEAEGLGGLSNFEGSGDMGDLGDMGEGFGQSPGLSDFGDPSAASGASQRGEGAGTDAQQGGGAGGAPGRVDQYQRPNGASPDSRGRVLELRGRPSDTGGSRPDNDSNVPLVASNDGSVAGAVGAGARSVIVDPLTVRGEQNFVPWEKRQIVKDYFTGAPK